MQRTRVCSLLVISRAITRGTTGGIIFLFGVPLNNKTGWSVGAASAPGCALLCGLLECIHRKTMLSAFPPRPSRLLSSLSLPDWRRAQTTDPEQAVNGARARGAWLPTRSCWLPVNFGAKSTTPRRGGLRCEVVILRIRWAWPASGVGKRGCDSTPAKNGA